MNDFMQKSIRLFGITKRFGEKTVLENLNLRIEASDFLAITGGSGSGKSTLINILGLLDDDYEGSYTLFGENVRELSERRRTQFRNQRLGFVFQAYHLIGNCSVQENILLPASYLGEKIEKGYYEELIEALEIGDLLKKDAALLSGGEKQRVCIARALINKPSLLIADEPTGNLDEENTERVYGIFRKINQRGTTIVMVTHDSSLASKAKRKLVLSEGRLTEAVR